MQLKTSLRYLEDRWDDQLAGGLDQPELLRYRSNLLGSDLRITNFGGGNTSSKIQQTDPLSGKQEEVLWIKGSGGDLGSIKLTGLAALYSEKLHGLEPKYRGAEVHQVRVGIPENRQSRAQMPAQEIAFDAHIETAAEFRP